MALSCVGLLVIVPRPLRRKNQIIGLHWTLLAINDSKHFAVAFDDEANRRQTCGGVPRRSRRA